MCWIKIIVTIIEVAHRKKYFQCFSLEKMKNKNIDAKCPEKNKSFVKNPSWNNKALTTGSYNGIKLSGASSGTQIMQINRLITPNTKLE